MRCSSESNWVEFQLESIRRHCCELLRLQRPSFSVETVRKCRHRELQLVSTDLKREHEPAHPEAFPAPALPVPGQPALASSGTSDIFAETDSNKINR
ncbi:hypothetical protein GCK72_000656 [Caenorhabditis remanei]|uniref:Uncharacterized protein n=1 Tax=Caenorhabditis remanei TaxID=31234 RepID=A0A6A5HRG5_CAERE|nr:hypothetical protein GCK72_000656 [Caenorhabditis remanei]KAF1768843.1 hypothetical protein GCK72_000656 [Caenorhabditis remanei]